MARRWFTRHGRTARTFRYRTAAGIPVTDTRVLERIAALVIPPGWTDVHVAAAPSAEVQAWGFDARGRKQYRYHDRAVARGALRKHYRVRRLAHDLPRIRAQVDEHFRGADRTRDQVAAAVVRLISQGFFRVGSERYAVENKTFGITTLRKRNVAVDGDCLTFSYVGKRSIEQRQTVVDRDVARWMTDTALATPGTRLFRYREAGKWRDLTARDVNAFLHDTLGVPHTAKDFRTWGGTLRAATVLADLGPAASPTAAARNVNTALRLVAAELGNTPAICRSSYVHPIVLARYLDDGETIQPRPAPRSSADRYAHAPEERALIRFLDRHFPERRSDRPADAPRAERRQP